MHCTRGFLKVIGADRNSVRGLRTVTAFPPPEAGRVFMYASASSIAASLPKSAADHRMEIAGPPPIEMK